jgi:hypothetical protein
MPAKRKLRRWPVYLVRVLRVHAVAEKRAVEHVDVLPRRLGAVDGRHMASRNGRGAEARCVLELEPDLD